MGVWADVQGKTSSPSSVHVDRAFSGWMKFLASLKIGRAPTDRVLMARIGSPEGIARPRWQRLLDAIAAEDYAEWLERTLHEAFEDACKEEVPSGAR